MYCINCGNKFAKTSKFCGECGSSAVTPDDNSQSKQKSQKASLLKRNILTIAPVVFALLFSALYAANVDTTPPNGSRTINFFSVWLGRFIVSALIMAVPMLIVQKTVWRKHTKTRLAISVVILITVLLFGAYSVLMDMESDSWSYVCGTPSYNCK